MVNESDSSNYGQDNLEYERNDKNKENEGIKRMKREFGVC